MLELTDERVIVLDTETTGFEWENGHRIIEVGCIELINRKPTGKTLHFYVDPKRDVPEDAVKVHGLDNETLEHLSEGREFKDHAKELFAFLKGAVLVAHNAKFDMGHLDAEYRRMGWPEVSKHAKIITDTLAMANNLYPKKRNSLDFLCRRLGVDNSGRELHGALLDAELLTDVYLIMTTQQNELLAKNENRAAVNIKNSANEAVKFEPVAMDLSSKLRVVSSDSDHDAHNSMVSRIRHASGDDEFSF